jgi:hypothetical protein
VQIANLHQQQIKLMQICNLHLQPASSTKLMQICNLHLQPGKW